MIKTEAARFMICAVITGWNIFLLGAKLFTNKFPKLSFSIYLYNYHMLDGSSEVVPRFRQDSLQSKYTSLLPSLSVSQSNKVLFALILMRFINKWLKHVMSDSGFSC